MEIQWYYVQTGTVMTFNFGSLKKMTHSHHFISESFIIINNFHMFKKRNLFFNYYKILELFFYIKSINDLKLLAGTE